MLVVVTYEWFRGRVSLQIPLFLSLALPCETRPGPEWKSEPQWLQRYCFLVDVVEDAMFSVREEFYGVNLFVEEERASEEVRMARIEAGARRQGSCLLFSFTSLRHERHAL